MGEHNRQKKSQQHIETFMTRKSLDEKSHELLENLRSDQKTRIMNHKASKENIWNQPVEETVLESQDRNELHQSTSRRGGGSVLQVKH